MRGYVISRSWSVPAYCFDSPRYVCLSVPQMPEKRTFISTAPGSGSGSGKRRTSRFPGAVITAARTVPLTALERYSKLELPAVVGVGRHQPAPARTGHDVQVVEVVARPRRDRV